MPDRSWLGRVVFHHLPLLPSLMLAEALPMQRQSSSMPPFGSSCLDCSRPQRHAWVSMNSGMLKGEEHLPEMMHGSFVLDMVVMIC